MEKTLEKDPDDRYQSVHEVRSNLRRLSEKLSAPDVTPASVKGKRSIWLGAGAVLIVLVALVLAIYFYQPSPTQVKEVPINSIAILPLENESEDPETEYLSDGIAENIAFKLAPIKGLRVVSPDQLQRYKGQPVNAQTVANELGVKAILSGNLRVLESTLALRVRLHDAQGNLLWGQPYSQPLSDVLLIQEAIAGQVVETLQLQLSEEERGRFAKRPTANAEANDMYLRGYAEGYSETAPAYFELALEKDPSFALARVSLARWYVTMGDIQSSSEYYEKARLEAEKALDIDPDLAETHWIKGVVLAYLERDWEGAGQEFALFRQIGPADRSYEWDWLYTSYSLWMGRPAEAVAGAERIKLYDPLTAANPHMYRWARQYQRAIEAAKKRGGDRSHLLTLCYQQLGMEEEEFQSFIKFDGNTEAKIRSYQAAHDESGMRGVWRRFIENSTGANSETREHLGYGKFFDVAATYAYLGEKDKAFEWLEKLVERPVAHPFVVDPRFDSIRDAMQRVERKKIDYLSGKVYNPALRDVDVPVEILQTLRFDPEVIREESDQFISQVKSLVFDTLDSAQVSPEEIAHFLLVGGPLQSPLVREKIGEFWPNAHELNVEARQLATARGCAKLARRGFKLALAADILVRQANNHLQPVLRKGQAFPRHISNGAFFLSQGRYDRLSCKDSGSSLKYGSSYLPGRGYFQYPSEV